MDHPRVCGEKPLPWIAAAALWGSPPRMRGKVPNRRSTETKPGITPAYAGKSTCLILFDTLLKDHPRVCGEKVLKDIKKAAAVGSPPRMRGKARPPSHRLRLHGITPAYAGKSAAPRGQCKRQRDHPRVCGEKAHHHRDGLPSRGSPPRMRGKD